MANEKDTIRMPQDTVERNYSKSQGEFVEYTDAVGIEKEWLKIYEILQYNTLFNEKYRSEVFFLN